MGINMQKLMKQAQKMQSDMLRVQEELKDKTVEGASGGGMVTVIANGKQDVLSIKINPEVVDPDDVEMLEDLLLAAVKDAIRLSQEMAAAEVQKVTGGAGLPPGMF